MLPGVAGPIVIGGEAGEVNTLHTLADTAGSMRTYAALNSSGNQVFVRHQHVDGQDVVTTNHTQGTAQPSEPPPILFTGNWMWPSGSRVSVRRSI